MSANMFTCILAALLFAHVKSEAQPLDSAEPHAVVQRTSQPDPHPVLAYWTVEKMKAAEARLGADDCISDNDMTDACGFYPVPTPQTEIASRLNGMLFFQDQDGQDHHCSASVIATPSRSMILTAATCLRQTTAPPSLKRYFMFVPAYDGQAPTEHRAPLGRWPIAATFIQNDTLHTNNRGIGAAKVYPRMDETGNFEYLEDVVGAGAVPSPSGGDDTGIVPGPVLAYPGTTSYGGPRSGRQYRCDADQIIGPGPRPQTASGFTAPPCTPAAGSEGAPIYAKTPSSIPELLGIAVGGSRFVRLTPHSIQPLLEAAWVEKK